MGRSSVRILVLGSIGSGKSAFIRRLVSNAWNPSLDQPTVGVARHAKQVTLSSSDQLQVELELWEVAGAEHFNEMAALLSSAVHAILVLFDSTELHSFERAKAWVEELCPASPDALFFCLIATKCDQSSSSHRQPLLQEAGQLAASKGISFSESSASSGAGVTAIMNRLAEHGRYIASTGDGSSSDLSSSQGEVSTSELTAPEWVDDSSTQNCTACNSVFTLTNRRHHCRKCGLIFCSSCSLNKMALPSVLGSRKPVRVCNGCYSSSSS